jgi:2-polyprenyl-6-methoxyphenol hydroxylase-like FAD-dependent oxidoreductase
MEKLHRRDHAIVLGGSMAGLAAARALSGHFRRVTVVERDDLPEEAAVRKGTPQVAHAHGLLASGNRVLEGYFPGLMDELVAGGARSGDTTGDILWFHFGEWKLRADCGLRGIVVTRPALEAAVRRRVRGLQNVTLLTGHDVEAPVFDSRERRVAGVVTRDRGINASMTLQADLVVDALGRGSQSTKWLSAWGFGDVEEESMKVDVGYATAVLERRPGDLEGKAGAIITGTPPHHKRHGVALHAEGGRWTVTLMGVLGDHPPGELDAWREFARSLPVPQIFELVRDRQPIGPLVTYRFAANRRRLFSRMKSFPAGFLALGDSWCSFNPIYGQGMSVALGQAKVLDDCLAEGEERLAPRFFSRAAPLADWAWAIASGEDLRFPAVVGKRPPGAVLIHRYMERVHHAASRDPVVLRRFFEVASLLAPPTKMLAPSIAWRVLVGGVGQGSASKDEAAYGTATSQA